MGQIEMQSRVEALQSSYRDQGVTFDIGGEERAFPLDSLPTCEAGVCQDVAHIAMGALRSIGIPAGYVFGSLHPRPEPVVGGTVSGKSHAWVEWWDDGWRGFDPTNDTEPGDRHVIVAYACTQREADHSGNHRHREDHRQEGNGQEVHSGAKEFIHQGDGHQEVPRPSRRPRPTALAWTTRASGRSPGRPPIAWPKR